MPRSVIRDNPYALSIPAGDSYANWTYAKTNGGAARTVAFWVKLRTVANNNQLISFGTVSTQYEGIKLMTNGQFRLELNGGAGGMRYTFPTANPLPATSVLDKWTHIAYTRGSFVSADARAAGDVTGTYINGVPLARATATIGGSTPSMLNLTLGVVGTTILTDDFNGIIDDVLVYERELSAAEIAQLALSAPPPSDYDFYAKLDEGAGTTPVALGASGSTGTISGATYTTDTPSKLRTASSNRVAVQDIKSSLSFNGSSTKVTVANPSLSTSSFSMGTWVKYTGDSSSSFPTVMSAFGTTSSKGALIYINKSSKSISSKTSISGTVTDTGFMNGLVNNSWYFVALTFDGTTIRRYVNGVPSVAAPTTSVAGVIDTNETAIMVGVGGDTGSPSNYFKGSLSGAFYGGYLTSAEILAIYTGNSSVAKKVSWIFDEGAGTTAYDSSGNGNNGTITSGTFTSDVPTKKRGVVGGNKVYNGDFSYTPTVNVATTTNARFADGTATGSTTNNLFGWGILISAGAGGLLLDTSVTKNGKNSLKISSLDTSGNITVSPFLNVVTPTAAQAIRLEPSTSYTWSGWVKTSNVGANGAFIDLREYTGAMATVATTSTSKLSGTTDWTYVTGTATTGATTRYGAIILRNVIPGTISDAWYSDIILTETTPVTRTVVT